MRSGSVFSFAGRARPSQKILPFLLLFGALAAPAWADRRAKHLRFDRVDVSNSAGEVIPPPGEADFVQGMGLLNRRTGRNPAAALEKIRASHASGFLPATYQLGALLTFGAEGISQSVPEGLSRLQAAATGGHVQALFTVGKMLGDGKGYVQNPALARSLLALVVEAGVPEAKGSLRVLKGRPQPPSQESLPWIDLEDCFWTKPYPNTSLPTSWQKATFVGVISLTLQVDEQGKVTQSKVVFGNAEMGPGAQELARKLQFQPMVINGVSSGFQTIWSLRLNHLISRGLEVNSETITTIPLGRFTR